MYTCTSLLSKVCTHICRLFIWLAFWALEKFYSVSVSVRGFRILTVDEVIIKSRNVELVGNKNLVNGVVCMYGGDSKRLFNDRRWSSGYLINPYSKNTWSHHIHLLYCPLAIVGLLDFMWRVWNSSMSRCCPVGRSLIRFTPQRLHWKTGRKD